MNDFVPMTDADIEKFREILARTRPGDITCLPDPLPLRNPLPIVGRTVQFFGSAWRTGMPPLAALITAVHSDCSVWLAVFEPDGRPWETIRGPFIVGPPPVRFVKPEEPEPHRDARILYAENPGNPLPAFEPFCKYPPE